ncbi:MAG: protein-arginine deiminase family protein [Myxococcaceae bacterium]
MPTWKARLLIGVSAALAACSGPPSANGDPDSGTPDIVVGEDGGTDTRPDAGHTVTETHAPIVDLRADVNRDGVVSLDRADEDLDEALWSAERGAIFLANIDDDEDRCTYATNKSDVDLAKCHDAEDDQINGDADLLDLAYLRTVPWEDAPDGTTARLTVSEKASSSVRLFMSDGTAFASFDPAVFEFNALSIRSGLEFAIEARDIVRDPAKWDGYVDVTLSITVPQGSDFEAGTFTDVVRLRVSPVMTFHHLLAAETLYVSDVEDRDSTLFMNALRGASTASGVQNPVKTFQVWDQWTQDFFESGYMSMPAAGGKQHVIRVNYRSANVYYPDDGRNPLRDAGRVVFQLLGRDVAAVQQYDIRSNPNMDSLNSFGNTETIPPYAHDGKSYPLGRSYRGSVPTFYTDKAFTKMMEAQAVQPPVYVDTSWLLVGHVDETVSFLKVNSPRGWVVLVNDVALAKAMLEAEQMKGNGGLRMFVGKKWVNDSGRESVAEVTIDAVLADTDVMNESAASAAEVDAQLEILRRETGITDAEIVRVPFLHQPVDGTSLAYQPGTVNLLSINERNVLAPDPFGPVINGKDIFKAQLEEALAPYGITVRWVDDWNLYHRLAGEVHCGTNAARTIPAEKWWEGGR